MILSRSSRYAKLYASSTNACTVQRMQESSSLMTAAGRWKGKCNKCGKQGHKAVDCCSNGARAHKDKADKGAKGFDGKCHNCQKTGHRASNCFKKKRDYRMKKNTWLGDSAASTHIFSDKGMIDLEVINSPILQ
jgi:hypothetical protein